MVKKSVAMVYPERIIAPYLALRVSADRLFEQIEKMPQKEVMVDFSKVTTMTRSFAHQYRLRKKTSKKTVSETNMAAEVKLVMSISMEPVKMAAEISSTIKPMRLPF